MARTFFRNRTYKTMPFMPFKSCCRQRLVRETGVLVHASPWQTRPNMCRKACQGMEMSSLLLFDRGVVGFGSLGV